MIPIRAYLRLFAGYLRPFRRTATLLALVLTGTIALQLVNPQLIKLFIDGAVAGDDISALVPIAIAFMVIAVAHQGLMVWATYLAEQVGWSATNQLRVDLADHVLHLDLGFHKSTSPGELIERIDGDVTALSNFFSSMIIKVLANAAMITGIVVLLWIESWIIGLAVSVLIVITFTGLFRLHGVTVPWQKAIRATSAEMYGFIGEQIDGTEDIEANGATGYMISRFDSVQRRWLPETVRGWTGWAMMWSASMALYFASIAVGFVLGAWLFTAGALTIGGVYIVLQYIQMAHRPIEQIREELIDLQKAGASIERVQELFDREPQLTRRDTRTLPNQSLAVAFESVTFSYNDDGGHETVLDDVSFSIAPGRVVGLLGRTGSGKSTIARLLTHLHEPQWGSVKIGQHDTRDIDLANLRHHVAMVTQDVQLFRATIRENLTFFDASVPDDRLRSVIERLELAEWLDSLPNGLDTVLESGGGGLSAGQAQLLAFTRVFLRDPGVIVLDEASSRLDPATETLLERAIDHLLEDRTAIVIAHRLSTVQRADDIIILEDGRVVETGERGTLAADPESLLSALLATGMEEVLA
ncbi:MAG: ABC transporter ATP-binding protein [Actinomycetota bacterium]